MCGIGGYYTRNPGVLTPDVIAKVRAIHLSLVDRGKEGAGIAIFTDNPEQSPALFKNKETAGELWKQNGDEIEKTLATQSVRCIIFHCRQPTSGSKDSIENVHPIVYNNLFLVHNGTIDDSPFEKKKKTDVDSEAIIRAVIYHNSDKVDVNKIGAALSKHIKGAMACLMYDIDTDWFYVWRNSERPLWSLSDGDVIWFASTDDDIMINEMIGDIIIGGHQPIKLPADIVLGFNPENGKIRVAEFEAHRWYATRNSNWETTWRNNNYPNYSWKYQYRKTESDKNKNSKKSLPYNTPHSSGSSTTVHVNGGYCISLKKSINIRDDTCVHCRNGEKCSSIDICAGWIDNRNQSKKR